MNQWERITVPEVARAVMARALVAARVECAFNPDPVPRDSGSLYFVSTVFGVVKVGHTVRDVRHRIVTVSRENSNFGPMYAVAWCSATRAEELAFHEASREASRGGQAPARGPSRLEWYRAESPAADVVNFIDWTLGGKGSMIVSRPRPLISFRGEKLSIWRWARRANSTEELVRSRIAHGWPLEASLTTPGTRTRRAA